MAVEKLQNAECSRCGSFVKERESFLDRIDQLSKEVASLQAENEFLSKKLSNIGDGKSNDFDLERKLLLE